MIIFYSVVLLPYSWMRRSLEISVGDYSDPPGGWPVSSLVFFGFIQVPAHSSRMFDYGVIRG